MVHTGGSMVKIERKIKFPTALITLAPTAALARRVGRAYVREPHALALEGAGDLLSDAARDTRHKNNAVLEAHDQTSFQCR
jgi:hypothetical protein